MAKSTSRAEGRVKQLCCLGLGGPAVISALLTELHGVLPTYANNFHFADETGLFPSSSYHEHPGFAGLMPVFVEEWYERRDHEIRNLAYSEASAVQFGVQDAAATVGPDYAETIGRHDFYHAIGVPLGYGLDFLRLFVRDGRRTQTLGAFHLASEPGWRGWTADEKRRLARLEPFFAYALTGRSEGADVLTDSGRSGVIVADPEGKPVHLSPEGRRLLFLASHPNAAPGSVVGRVPTLPPSLVHICRNLSRATSAEAQGSAPIHHHKNVWGGFSFRAEWLDSNDQATGRIAIAVTHQEPLQVRLIRATASLPLTRRQAEVCILMASGLSRDQIAERLGISRHTAGEHGRWIYNRLDVHSRSELLGKLLATPIN